MNENDLMTQLLSALLGAGSNRYGRPTKPVMTQSIIDQLGLTEDAERVHQMFGVYSQGSNSADRQAQSANEFIRMFLVPLALKRRAAEIMKLQGKATE
jgi:hypothetical protein